jgi:hypothetical protein
MVSREWIGMTCPSTARQAPHKRALQDRPDRWKRMSGRGDRIRTCDILLPKQARYQTALLPDEGRPCRENCASSIAIGQSVKEKPQKQNDWNGHAQQPQQYALAHVSLSLLYKDQTLEWAGMFRRVDSGHEGACVPDPVRSADRDISCLRMAPVTASGRLGQVADLSVQDANRGGKLPMPPRSKMHGRCGHPHSGAHRNG